MDLEQDDDVAMLFRALDGPRPSAGFARRAVQAARREPLPEGRRALGRAHRRTLAAAASLAAISAVWLFALAGSSIVATLTTVAVAAGLRSASWVASAVDVLLTVSTVALALANAVASGAGAAVLVSVALAAALALTTLQRVLASDL
jgi:hypothetical protein